VVAGLFLAVPPVIQSIMVEVLKMAASAASGWGAGIACAAITVAVAEDVQLMSLIVTSDQTSSSGPLFL
jgi:hypothetical protein